MTRQELIDFCLTLPDAYEDYPFSQSPDPSVWVTMRHAANKKIFAMIYERNGGLHINVKCDPFEADFLRQTFRGISPGYHMNKMHWNTITTGGDVPAEEIQQQISHSYDLIKPKRIKKSPNN